MIVSNLIAFIPNDESVCIQTTSEQVLALNEWIFVVALHPELMNCEVLKIYSERYPAIASRGITLTIMQKEVVPNK